VITVLEPLLFKIFELNQYPAEARVFVTGTI